jgi:hypothetical protein
MKSAILTALTITLFGTSVAAADAPARTAGETALQRALDGRTAGKPLDCLKLRKLSSRIIDGTAVVFESSGTLFVNRPVAGAETLSASKALMVNSLNGEICRGEAIHLFDSSSRVETGVIFLGEFVPYRRSAHGDYAPAASGPGRYR